MTIQEQRNYFPILVKGKIEIRPQTFIDLAMLINELLVLRQY